MKYAWLSVAAGEHDNAVSTGSELVSTYMWSRNFEPECEAKVHSMESNPSLAFEKDFLRWMLSDGASAALLQATPNQEGISLRIDGIDMFSYANLYPPCMYAGGVIEQQKLVGWREMASWKTVLEQSAMSLKQDARLLDEGIPDIFNRGYTTMLEKRQLQAKDVDWFLQNA
jgi:3-oxoacyl-[acyl-carrier-protein] synthase-3